MERNDTRDARRMNRGFRLLSYFGFAPFLSHVQVEEDSGAVDLMQQIRALQHPKRRSWGRR